MNSRVSKRSHQACENCRRKKTRCPGERPACSTCTRLQQSCQYSRGWDAWEDSSAMESRLKMLEQKMDLMLEGSMSTHEIDNPETPKSYSHGLESREATAESSDMRDPSTKQDGSSDSMSLQLPEVMPFTLPSKEIVSESIGLYFRYCHKQPLWLFDPEDLASPENCRNEVIFGVLTLALRYSDNPLLEGRKDQMCRQYAESARGLVMFRIAQGSVDLSTMQSLCLIALAEYTSNDTDLAWLHIGLVTNLAKCGGLDVEQNEGSIFPASEAKRRLFWSIHFLDQQYGLRNMQLDMFQDIQRPVYMAMGGVGSPREMGTKPPQLPQENGSFSARGDIWVYMVQLGCFWSEVQQYVSHCSVGDATPPWSVKSGYSILGAHLMDIETKFPTRHRWDSVRFWEQPKEELQAERWYWSPWLYLQFTYHAIHSVLNHPFIYSWRPQQSAQLSVPNTFWKTSSELALIHSTWTVRLIEMITEKEYLLSDPFLAHTVSIAATIHIYYCRAADPAVRESAQRAVEICTKFLGELATKWPRCQTMYQKLQSLVHSAFTGSPDSNNKRSSRRTLSIDTALMWDILLHNSSRSSYSSSGDGLFDLSFLQAQTPSEKHQDKLTVETEIFHRSTRAVDTSDGGQALPPYSSTVGGRDRDNSQSPLHGPWNADTIDSNATQIPLPREPFSYGPGAQGDMSFMDITHDPFFQFQDHQQPYMGIWEIGNL